MTENTKGGGTRDAARKGDLQFVKGGVLYMKKNALLVEIGNTIQRPPSPPSTFQFDLDGNFLQVRYPNMDATRSPQKIQYKDGRYW
jgi:hypothetical protein